VLATQLPLEYTHTLGVVIMSFLEVLHSLVRSSDVEVLIACSHFQLPSALQYNLKNRLE
jgi:hypothetical protein